MLTVKLMKEEIKQTTISVRVLKKMIKDKQKSGDYTAATDQSDLSTLRVNVRHLFIAYGFVRNKLIEKIECKNSKPYKEDLVTKIIEDFKKRSGEVS